MNPYDRSQIEAEVREDVAREISGGGMLSIWSLVGSIIVFVFPLCFFFSIEYYMPKIMYRVPFSSTEKWMLFLVLSGMGLSVRFIGYWLCIRIVNIIEGLLSIIMRSINFANKLNHFIGKLTWILYILYLFAAYFYQKEIIVKAYFTIENMLDIS